ncbi:MAG: hypothetical protein HZA82_02925 [Thaumarchaeota archaeon]|nr:hypothetical protein [Nitrososphaerota archaeon]
MTQDIHAKSESFDEQGAKRMADNSNQLKGAVKSENRPGNDQYRFNSVSYTWNNDSAGCTAKLKDVLVQYTATDDNGKDRTIVIVVNPDHTVNRAIVERDIFQHDTATSPNWGGQVLKGASTEASSLVYRSTMNWSIPTPNDPPQLDCGTSGAQLCNISVWTGLSQTSAGNNMAQVGTDSFCAGNNCSSGRLYQGWLETVPGGKISTCSTITFAANDSMYGEVSNQKRSGGSVTKYDFYLIDTTQGLTCSIPNYTFGSTDPHYAHYMTERALYVPTGTYTHLASFSPISGLYGILYYGGANHLAYDAYSQGSSWYLTKTMNNGTPNESISAINSSNVFTVTWLTSQGM